MENTKQYKGKTFSAPAVPSVEMPAEKDSIVDKTVEMEVRDAPNPDRRAWFNGLVPAFGESLVKILRTSNHLKTEAAEVLRQMKSENNSER